MVNAIRPLLRAGASALLIIFFAAPAYAVPVIDQEQPHAQSSHIFSKTTQMRQLAQTFTAGTTGNLAGVSLRLGARFAGAQGGVVVQIRDTENSFASIGTGWVPAQIPGSPDITPTGGQILASAFIAASDLSIANPSFAHLPDFTPMIEFDVPVSLVSGNRYSILIFSSDDFASDSEFVWAFSRINQFAPPDYTGGSGFYRGDTGYGWTMPNRDYAFRTFIDGPATVPEPSSVALLAVGLLGLSVAASARRARS